MRMKWFRAFLFAAGIVICLPIFAVILGAFKSGRELEHSLSAILGVSGGTVEWHLLPLYPTPGHFINLLFFTPEFLAVFWNSMKIVGGILLGQMFVAVPAAWAFAKFSFRGRRALYLSYVILMLMPFSVMMLPSYLVLNGMRLMDTHWAVILPAMFSTFPVFLMYRGFAAIPKDLYEAAKIDGANEWQGSGCRWGRREFCRLWCLDFWSTGIWWSSLWRFWRNRRAGRCRCICRKLICRGRVLQWRLL